MRGSVELRFSEKAQEDLRALGRLERSLIPQAIKDQLVAPSWSDVEILEPDSVGELVSATARATPPQANENSPWWSVRIGNYRAVVRPQRSEETGDFGAFVARILPDTESALTADSSPASSAAEVMADTGGTPPES